MTSVILNAVKPPRQVAPSSARYACHLSRFNGRAYSRKGGLPRSIYNNVFARPPVGRGNPEDWRENAHTAAPPFIAGILHCVQNDTFGRVGSGGLI